MCDRPRLKSLVYIGFQVISAIDSGYGYDVSFDEIYNGMKNGTLLVDLEKKFPSVLDFSLYPQSDEKSVRIHKALYDAGFTFSKREWRKLGIKKNGLCLLCSFIIEAIQQGYFIQSKKS